MSTQELVVGGPESRGRAVMSRSASRVAAMGLALVLAVLLAGDRGRAGTVPAAIYGQDPLEVLELKVRPNIIVVLDSSGSMTNVAPETTNTNSGDHPRSKLYQAKRVLRQVIQDNQDIVSFQLGTYTQNGIGFDNQGAGANRFQYVTDSMPAPELTVRRALGDGGHHQPRPPVVADHPARSGARCTSRRTRRPTRSAPPPCPACRSSTPRAGPRRPRAPWRPTSRRR